MSVNGYLKFKSGSDIRGIGIGDGSESLYMNDEFVSRCAVAFAEFLSNRSGVEKSSLKIAIGHDSRLSAQRISEALIRGFLSCGVSVFDCGLSSTPAMFMAVLGLDCDGSVQITASHHPGDRNGLKFFTGNGGLDSKDIEFILKTAENACVGEPSGEPVCVNFIDSYASHLRSVICKETGKSEAEKPLSGMKIMVDAGNGAGGFYADKVLKPLGADVSSSINLEPDGSFPAYVPNPESSVMVESASKQVLKSGADFGILFDTDVDRAGCILGDGTQLNRNRLIALISAVILEKEPGATIVTDSVTSSGLAEFISAHGGKHLRFKRGYRNVINKQIELNESGINCPLAIETSGHAALKENYYLDDGAYLVTKLVIKAAQLRTKGDGLESFISDLKEPKEEKELRFKINLDDFKAYGEEIIAQLKAQAEFCDGWCTEKENFEGIRINTDKQNGDGWFLLRLSVHDPIMVLNCESDSLGGAQTMLDILKDFLSQYDKLDLSVFEK